MTPYGNIQLSFSQGLVADGTRPLSEPILTSHQWGLVSFTWEHFQRKCSKYSWCDCWKFRITGASTRDRWVDSPPYCCVFYLWTQEKQSVLDECGPLNSLLSREITWWHRSVPTLAQVKGLLPDDTKPLLERILVSHLWYSVTFTWGQIHKKCCRYLSLIWVWKLLMVQTGNKFHIYV